MYLNIFRFSLRTALQFACMGAFDRCDDCGNRRQLSTSATGFHSNTVTLWTIWCIEPSFLGDCAVLHYICMCSQLGWSSQLVSIASALATNIKNLLRNLFTAFSSAISHSGFNENSALFQRIHCFPYIPWVLCDYGIHINYSIVGIWIANRCNRKNII